jgi:hypothetical protein
MVLMIVMIQHTCLAETKIIDLDNGKEWDAENQTITIFNESSKTKLMAVKLILIRPDLCTFTEIYEVSNFEVYTPDTMADFKARTNTVVGSGAVTNVEWFIEQNVSYVENVTDYGIKQVEEIIYNNKTGKNETVLVNRTVITGYHDETRYRDVWIDYQPYDKEMKIGSVQRIKVVYHKVPELGLFQIQTIPVFRGVECPELTWWSGSWDRRRAILINNIGGDSVTDYQLKSVNLASYNINASSARIINSTSNLHESFWNETVDVSGNLEYVWCNFSSLPNGAWINSTYYIYYQSSSSVSSVSSGHETFIKYDGLEDGDSSDAGDFIILGTNWASTSHPHSGTYDLEVPTGQGTQKSQSMSSLAFGSVVCGMWVYPQDITHRLGTIYIYDSADQIAATVKLEDGNLYGYSGGWSDSGQGYSSGNQVKIEILCSGVDEFYARADNGVWAGPYDYPGISLNINKVGFTSDDVICYCDDFYVRKYTSNEPELWTVGLEEEYTPTPTPTPVHTPSVSPVQYDELDLPLILYILLISMLYLLIAFRNGVATIELSLIYLIFAFIFLLFQTVTMSVNYIYLTLFLLLFLISIAGITKQGVD